MQPPVKTAPDAHAADDSGAARPVDPEPDNPPPPSGKVRATLDLLDGDRRLGDDDRHWLIERAEAALNIMPLKAGGEVRARLVGDDEMSRLHETYMGDPSTTDVLTFDLTEGVVPGGAALRAVSGVAPVNDLTGGTGVSPVSASPDAAHPLDVDLALCVDEADRHGALRSGRLREELLLYLIHGVLHCLGHDDADEASARRMHEREDEILRAIGVGDVYAPSHEGECGRAT